jgi:hypothetical protein
MDIGFYQYQAKQQCALVVEGIRIPVKSHFHKKISRMN